MTQLLTLATYVVLARLAPPKTFGTFAAASIVSIVATVFTESGMSAALIARRQDIERAAVTAFVSTVAGGSLLTLLAAALAPAVGYFFESSQVTRVALALSGIHFFNGLSVVPEALLQRRFSFLRRVLVDPIATVAFGAVSIFSFMQGLGIWSLVFGTYAFVITKVILALFFCRWVPNLSMANWATWRELTRFARHIVLSELLRESRQVLNTALIGRVLGARSLGEYRFGWRIATQVPAPAVQAGAYVLLPAFASIAENPARFGAAFLRTVRSSCLLTVPVSLMLAPLGVPVAVLVFGREWRLAGVVAACLVGVSATVPLLSISSEIFKAGGAPKHLPVIHLLLAVVPGAFMVAGVPYGVAGVAVGMSVGSVVVSLEALRRASAVAATPLAAALRAIWPPTAGGIVGGAAVFAIDRGFLDAATRSPLTGLVIVGLEFALGITFALLISVLLSHEVLEDVRKALRLVRGGYASGATGAVPSADLDSKSPRRSASG
jgi:O-antigen/teichoic acid export membrane protein